MMRITAPTTKNLLKEASKGRLKVTSRNGYERQMWTDGAILVLESPDHINLPKGNYDCEHNDLMPTKLPFPDIKTVLDGIDKRKYHKAEPDKEKDYIKLWYSDWNKNIMVTLVNGDNDPVFINYKYYSYLTKEKHTWRVDNWKIKDHKSPVLAYADDTLLAVIMPIDFREKETS